MAKVRYFSLRPSLTHRIPGVVHRSKLECSKWVRVFSVRRPFVCLSVRHVCLVLRVRVCVCLPVCVSVFGSCSLYRRTSMPNSQLGSATMPPYHTCILMCYYLCRSSVNSEINTNKLNIITTNPLSQRECFSISISSSLVQPFRCASRVYTCIAFEFDHRFFSNTPNQLNRTTRTVTWSC